MFGQRNWKRSAQNCLTQQKCANGLLHTSSVYAYSITRKAFQAEILKPVAAQTSGQSSSQLSPVHTPSLVSVAQLEELWSNIGIGFEGIDNYIVDLIPPNEHIAPNAKAVPLIWSPQSPRLHYIL